MSENPVQKKEGSIYRLSFHKNTKQHTGIIEGLLDRKGNGNKNIPKFSSTQENEKKRKILFY